MADMTNEEDAQAVLKRLGLVVPAADIPLLQRTLQRQRDVVHTWRSTVPPTTEPAHIFKVRS